MAQAPGDIRAHWPQIGDIIPNHNGHCPPILDALAGLHTFLGGQIGAEINFGARNLLWREAGQEQELEYNAFGLGSGLFLIDAMPAAPDRRSLTLVFDVTHMRAMTIEVHFPTPAEAQTAVLERVAATGSQSAVKVCYRQGAIGTHDAVPFMPSRALIGKHLRYTYSGTHVYDHYYLSERFYSWLCREGPDKGLGDFEECDYFELGHGICLISWREKLLPCAGILAEDHNAMRFVGKICGADAYTGEIGNTRVGGTMRLIADTSQR